MVRNYCLLYIAGAAWLYAFCCSMPSYPEGSPPVNPATVPYCFSHDPLIWFVAFHLWVFNYMVYWFIPLWHISLRIRHFKWYGYIFSCILFLLKTRTCSGLYAVRMVLYQFVGEWYALCFYESIELQQWIIVWCCHYWKLQLARRLAVEILSNNI